MPLYFERERVREVVLSISPLAFDNDKVAQLKDRCIHLQNSRALKSAYVIHLGSCCLRFGRDVRLPLPLLIA